MNVITRTSDQTIVATSQSWDSRTQAPALSIVVPVYNTEEFVLDTLNSLIATELEALEIIIVHDGGKDKALEICADWVKRTPAAACLIDQPNQGLSGARHSGIALATGEFLGFLDSDDVIDVEVLMRMVHDGRDRRLDIVMAGSVVLDHNTLSVSPFYDHHLWDELTQKHEFRRVNPSAEPRVFRLEPNTNTRIIRRTFFLESGLKFPSGRLFEDLPVHVKSLLRAQQVGLRKETLYFYRVNRFGKITNERSKKRFDAIHNAGETIKASLAAQASPWAGAEILRGTMRLVFWCAENVTNAHRLEFCAQAVKALSAAPDAWFATALAVALDKRERMLLSAFWHGDPEILACIASKSSWQMKNLLGFLTSKKAKGQRRHILSAMGR